MKHLKSFFFDQTGPSLPAAALIREIEYLKSCQAPKIQYSEKPLSPGIIPKQPVA